MTTTTRQPPKKGLVCPHCKAGQLRTVTQTRKRTARPYTWRRRRCDNCKKTAATQERVGIPSYFSVVADAPIERRLPCPACAAGPPIACRLCGSSREILIPLTPAYFASAIDEVFDTIELTPDEVAGPLQAAGLDELGRRLAKVAQQAIAEIEREVG